MAYLQTSASDCRNLLTVIKNFAIGAPAWTSVYDDIVANGQLGIEKGNCHLSIGEKIPVENPVVRTDAVNGGTVNDAYLYMVVNESLNAANKQFWGHPNSIVISATDTDRVPQNDLYGAFTNVWLFSDAGGTYIWCVTQQGGDRFNSFGFGVLDKKQMTNPNVAFCVGTDYTWWPNYADYTNQTFSIFNRPSSASHIVGPLCEPSGIMCYLPDTVVDPTLGFTDGNFQTKNIRKVMTRGWQDLDHQAGNAGGEALDYFLTVDNQFTTSGIPLSSIPVRYQQSGLEVFLGELPDIRIVNLGTLSPAQEITFSTETWKCFPLKRKGLRSDTCQGNSPQPYLNTIEYALAIKKI